MQVAQLHSNKPKVGRREKRKDQGLLEAKGPTEAGLEQREVLRSH